MQLSTNPTALTPAFILKGTQLPVLALNTGTGCKSPGPGHFCHMSHVSPIPSDTQGRHTCRPASEIPRCHPSVRVTRPFHAPLGQMCSSLFSFVTACFCFL